MSVTIKLKRGLASQWVSSGSTVLASGEPAYETDTGRFKIGDGVTAWSGLVYTSIVPSGFLAGSGINIGLGSNGSTATISVSGLNSSYISDFNEAVDDRIGSGLLVAGTGISLSYNDPGNSLTIDVQSAPKIITRVFNNTGSSIPKMRAVYISGGQGDQPTIALAIATGDTTSSKTYGITNEAISNMSNGDVIILGALTGVNTDPAHGGIAGGANGVTVYLSPITSGLLTTTKPYAPDHIVALGTIVRTHQNEGIVEVRIQNGYELEELHNVATTGATNSQFLQYNASNGLWVPSSSGNFTNLTINNSGIPIGSGTTNYSARWISSNTLGTGVLYDNGTNVGIGTSSPNYQLDVSSTGNISTLKFSSIDVSSLPSSTGISNSGVLIFVEPTGVVTTYKITGSGLRSSLLDQPAVLRFRQGTDAERVLVTFASGEPVWTTDTKKFYIGDGTTAGGLIINGGSGVFTSLEVDYLKLDGNTLSSTSGVIIISPSGSQAIQASSGGNSRGSYALDLQRTRTNNNQVASGNYSSIFNGQQNIVSGDYSAVIGGQENKISSTNNYCSIIAGKLNSISVSTTFGVGGSVVGGYGNTLSGNYGSYNYAFGKSNTITSSAYGSYGNFTAGFNNNITNGNQNAVFGGATIYPSFANTVSGGSYNLVAGYNNEVQSSSCICAGDSNTISTLSSISVVFGGSNTIYSNSSNSNIFGQSNAVSGTYCSILGGISNSIIADYGTILGGIESKVNKYGEIAHSAGGFSNIRGTSQHSTLVVRRSTTTNTANQVLFLDGSSSRLVIPAKTTWTFTVTLSAYNDTDSAGAGWIFRGAIRRDGSNSTSIIGSVIEENWKDSAMSSTSAGVVADDTNEALEIRVTGLTSKNIRWSAVVDLSQVSYGTP